MIPLANNLNIFFLLLSLISLRAASCLSLKAG